MKSFSQRLRDAFAAKLDKSEAVNATLTDKETFELELEDKDGSRYKGRLTGKLIASEERGSSDVYLTDDKRVILYDRERLEYRKVDDPETDLAERLEPGAYREACTALGIKPTIVIDI
jgi:hypothetical protein